jgi:NAD-dependent SIR2 family protein deacetylase
MVQTRLQQKVLRRQSSARRKARFEDDGRSSQRSSARGGTSSNDSSSSISDKNNDGARALNNSTSSSPRKRRRSNRGSRSGLEALAGRIVRGDKVVFLTGAGLSVASGVRPFRAVPEAGGGLGAAIKTAGLWNSVIWTTATRECFRKDPLRWYNRFFLPHFFRGGPHRPNWGHKALNEMLDEFDNVFQVTQNIDGLQGPSPRLIEVHGRVGLYKCLNDEDDDSDWDESDLEGDENDGDDDNSKNSNNSEDDCGAGDDSNAAKSGTAADNDDDSDERSSQRRVRLGHRGKSRRYQEESGQCEYRYRQPLHPHQIQGPPHVLAKLAAPLDQQPTTGGSDVRHDDDDDDDLDVIPTCPGCGKTVMPLALLFDEGYHSHSFYNFEAVEAWIEAADVLVFCGTSFSVRVTSVALRHAQRTQLPVYNFNTIDLLSASKQLNVTNIVGDVEETLPRLMRECREQRESLLRSSDDAGAGGGSVNDS